MQTSPCHPISVSVCLSCVSNIFPSVFRIYYNLLLHLFCGNHSLMLSSHCSLPAHFGRPLFPQTSLLLVRVIHFLRSLCCSERSPYGFSIHPFTSSCPCDMVRCSKLLPSMQEMFKHEYIVGTASQAKPFNRWHPDFTCAHDPRVTSYNRLHCMIL